MEKSVFNEVNNIINNSMHGVLSTINSDNYPFGSVIPYVLDRSGQIIILISHIAEHAKNISNNNHVSVTIIENTDKDDIQKKGRVTFIGNADKIDDTEDVNRMYTEIFPKGKMYFEKLNFHYYRIELYKMRYIGGFGKAYWINRDEFKENYDL